MNNMPLVNGLLKYVKENNMRMHMPGHKAGRMLFRGISKKQLLAMDVTEVDATDNLINPSGIIKQTEEKIAKMLGVHRAFLLTGGSTLGVISIMAAVLGDGDRVIMDRNCHISAFSALAITGAVPFYVRPSILSKSGVYNAVTPSDIEKALNQCKGAKAVFITSPNVFGICSDIESIAKICKKHGVPLLVDAAHGAHFAFCDKLPKTAMECGADMCTLSFHKTLPALTQTAVLCVKNAEYEEKVNRAIRLFHSSSPSYLLMASMDSATCVMQREGGKKMGALIKTIQENIADNMLCLPNKDILRIVIECDGEKAEKILLKNKIVPEMVSDGALVCIVTACDKTKEVKRLLRLAKTLPPSNKTFILPPVLESSVTPRKALHSDWEYVCLEDAAGRISKEAIYLYPPGVPIVASGEEITEEMVTFLKEAGTKKLNGVNEKGAIKVIV